MATPAVFSPRALTRLEVAGGDSYYKFGKTRDGVNEFSKVAPGEELSVSICISRGLDGLLNSVQMFCAP